MGVVTVPTSASRTPLRINWRYPTHQSPSKKPSIILAFKQDKGNQNTALSSPHKPVPLPIETTKETRRKTTSLRSVSKSSLSKSRAVKVNAATTYVETLDYNEAAAKLESIYKLSPATTDSFHDENVDLEPRRTAPRRRGRRKRTEVDDKERDGSGSSDKVVKNKVRKARRLGLGKRIELRKTKDEKMVPASEKKKLVSKNEDDKLEELVREYSASTDVVSLDWKKMKIPPVLPSSEHTRLFKLMQPMKALRQLKENLHGELEREPTDKELGEAMNISAMEVRRHMEVGHAARNKLIKHNLRLVLFVMNKYFHEFTNGPKFQDLCQEGVKGLITAIDRFEPKRSFRLSTYGLFWIRHAIIRSMTVSSFTRVSFGLESVRVEIQKAKLQLMFELKRMPTEEEIIKRVGISPERYQEVMKASKPVFSLHTRNQITQEELIAGIADIDGVGGDKRRQPALLRLALDDVLDSLKPKESLVIRQRYGLDGKGDRTLGEIAGNLNISREMVRKHEVKALMKLKHPARMDYLRRYVY